MRRAPARLYEALGDKPRMLDSAAIGPLRAAGHILAECANASAVMVPLDMARLRSPSHDSSTVDRCLPWAAIELSMATTQLDRWTICRAGRADDAVVPTCRRSQRPRGRLSLWLRGGAAFTCTGVRTGRTDIAGGLLPLLALQIVQVTLRENHAASAPIANEGRLNLAPLNQLMLGSSAGAKQFLELGTDRNAVRKLDDRGPSGRLNPSIVHGLLPS